MLDFIKNVLQWLLVPEEQPKIVITKDESKNSKSKNLESGISFPEYNQEEYQKQKKEREDKAINGFIFWDKLNLDIFQSNIEFLYNKKCPYCGYDLPERKGKSYKCPVCNKKIYRIKDIISNFEGLFTEEQKKVRACLKKEYSKRKNFLKIYENVCNYLSDIHFEFDKDKEQNIKYFLNKLHDALPYTKKTKMVNSLRMSRFWEAEAQELYGEPTEALNVWLSVAYIDLWGLYNYKYEDRDEYDKEEYDTDYIEHMKQVYIVSGRETEFNIEEMKAYRRRRREESKAPFIINDKTYILDKILKHTTHFESLKDLFKQNAEEISLRIKYNPPLSIEEAWEKLLIQYKNEKT